MIVDRLKNLHPGVLSAPAPRRAASRISAGRLRRSSRLERWRATRLDRLTERIEQRRERLELRWARLTPTDPRDGVTIRFRRRWHLLAERVEPLHELLLIRWYRFLFRVSVRWERLPVPTSLGRALAAMGISVALAVIVVAALPLAWDGRSPSGAALTDRPQAPLFSIGPARERAISVPRESSSETFTSEQAGYVFSHPSDWDVSTPGATTVLSDPEGQVVIAFDRGPPGPLKQASDRVLERFTATYSGVEFIATEVDRTPQGFGSISVGGTARDAGGAPIRFLVITIHGPTENLAISLHFPAGTDPRDLDPVPQIIGSFRIAPAA